MVREITYKPSPEIQAVAGVLGLIGKGLQTIFWGKPKEPETLGDELKSLMPFLVIIGGIALIIYIWKKYD